MVRLISDLGGKDFKENEKKRGKKNENGARDIRSLKI